jgi:predicted PurR-regulated permease PerM
VISTWARALRGLSLPGPPHWLETLPLVGAKIAEIWRDAAASGFETLTPYASQAGRWLASRAGDAGSVLVQSMLTVVIAAVLYAQGDATADGVLRFFERLGGDRGVRAVVLAAQATRSIALGVVVTAIAQSVLGGIGLLVAGVPFAGLLTIVMFMLCIAQVGPTVVLLPAVIWMYATGETGRATMLLVFLIVAGTMDNFLRPFLIKRGADLPLLLIFAGVIGGLISIGLVGIFVGPVVLAVTYRLLEEWVREGPTGDDGPT